MASSVLDNVAGEIDEIFEQQEVSLVHTLDIRGNLAGRFAAKRVGIKSVVSTRHEMYYSSSFPLGKKIRRMAYVLLDRLTAHLCQRFIVVSRAVGSELSLLERVPFERIVVIHNGIDLRELDKIVSTLVGEQLPKSLGLNLGAPVVGSIGRLIPEKGYETFIRAAKEILSSIPGISFLLVGDGPDRQRLEKLADELGLREKFLFLGFQEHVQAFLRSFDIFVLPSVHEGFGLTILEAMAMQKPVVATAVGGIPEVVANGESGILVTPQNPQGLAEAILTLLQERSKATEMGKKGRKIVEERFTLERMLKETEEVYSHLLSGKT